MANIKDCVVIEQDLLNEIVIQLGLSRNTELSNKLLFNHRKLKPIVEDAYFKEDYLFELTPADFNDYLNETEI